MLFQNIIPSNPALTIFYIILGLVDEAVTIYIIFYTIRQLRNKKEEWKEAKLKSNLYNLITWALFFLLISIASALVLIHLSTILISGGLTPETVKILEKAVMLLLYFAILIKIKLLKINRNQFIQALKAENIGAGIHFTALHLHQ